MALTEYRRKRDFAKTPEPAGVVARKTAARPLSFVIQKHAARRLHYDFRLELDGVLKSWAVPKGPSLDPAEKRLAVHVEDHPLEYGGFEGVIPERQYGAGTALIWDRGTWTPLDPDPEAAYAKGNLKFVLDGEKLHGKWALVRMGGKHAGRHNENWLLIKERDAAAMPQSGDAIVADNPRSVATGRALEEIAADRDRVWGPNGEERGPAAADPKPQARIARVPGAKKGRMAADPKPQLATAADQAPDGPQWFHEIKYDGYRLLARVRDGKAQLLTRNTLDWTEKFPALAERLAKLPVTAALIDGEIVHLEPGGTTDFGHLQDAISNERTDSLVFYAFDLLHLDGYDLTGAALEDRKALLAELVPPHSTAMLRYSDHQVGRGPELLRHACGYGLEGIVSKRRDRPYRPGRSNDWVKVKCANRDEFIVIGFTEPAGGRQGLGALLLGYYDRAGQPALCRPRRHRLRRRPTGGAQGAARTARARQRPGRGIAQGRFAQGGALDRTRAGRRGALWQLDGRQGVAARDVPRAARGQDRSRNCARHRYAGADRPRSGGKAGDCAAHCPRRQHRIRRGEAKQSRSRPLSGRGASPSSIWHAITLKSLTGHCRSWRIGR